jgi:hypothetical protein
LTSEKVAVDTQTIEPAFFVPFTDTREKGTSAIPSTSTFGTQIGDDVGTELNTFKSTSTFGGQTEPPSRTTFASQTDAPGFNTIGTQLGRTPVKKPVPLLPPVPKVPQVPPKRVPTLSSSETVSLMDIPPRPYTEMSAEELKVAVQYKGVKGAQGLNKEELQAVLQSDNPATTAAVLVRGKGKASAIASPADSAFEGVASSSRKRAKGKGTA